ncbi:MAG: hypothetical protein Aureis2KO_25530 [Aureisphaera sp.]
MKRISILVVALCFSQYLFAQECTRLYDFFQTQNNSNTERTHVAAAQSWVAPCTGQIEAVVVRTELITDPSPEVFVGFIEGTVHSPGSTLLSNYRYEFTDEDQVGQEDIITFPSPINVTAGQEYSITFEQLSLDIEFQISTSDPYDGGNFSRLTSLLGSWQNRAGVDMDFDIIVKDDPPTINCINNVTLTLDANGEVTTTFNALTNGSSDDIGVLSRILLQDTFTCDDIGDNEVTLTIVDTGNQSASCQTTVTIEDTTDPTISCASGGTKDVDTGTCVYTVQGTEFDPTFSDNCTTATVTNNFNNSNTLNGAALPLGNNTITWTVDDGNGQTATCQVTVTVEDDEAPTITCVANASKDTDTGECEYTVQGTEFDPTFSDNCTTATITNNFNNSNTLNGAALPVGDNTITWTVDDGNGQTATCQITVTVGDNAAPTITCVADATKDVDTGTCGYTVQGTEFNPTFSENCTTATVTNNFNNSNTLNGATLLVGDNTITWTVNDGNGQTATCQITVTVEDNVAPTITCVANATKDTDAGECEYIIQGTEFDPTFSDNCTTATVTNNFNNNNTLNGAILPVGDNTITWTVDDGNGQTATCQVTITVEDNEAPTVSDPGDISFSANTGTCGYTYTYDRSTFFSDNCDANLTIQQTAGLPSGSQFPLGDTVITHTATDDEGNVATSSFTITVTDDESPTIVCPGDITVIEDTVAANSAVVNYAAPTFTDNCSATADITITQTEGLSSGSTFPTGTTVNTFEVEDEDGNTSECSFSITVLNMETQVDLTNGAITITDINGGTSDDDITLSNDGTTLTISNLEDPVELSGSGLTLVDATTVSVLLADITAAIVFDAEGGTNGINFANALALSGVDNDITLNDITDYTQTDAIDIGGVFTIADSPNADIVLDALTATGLSITDVNSIGDNVILGSSVFRITGTTTLQATNTIVMDDASDRNVTFIGDVSLEASRITFVGDGINTTFQNITATDPTLGENYIRIDQGSVRLSGNVQTAGVSELHLSAFTSINQISGVISADVLTLSGRANGSTRATLGVGDNNIRLLQTFGTVSMREVAYNDINDVIIGTLTATEFDITATGTIFLTEETAITKTGTDISYLTGGDIEVDSNSTNATINHDAGSIIYTAETIDLYENITYDGLAGTTTELQSTATDFSSSNINIGGSASDLTFGYLNVTGGLFFTVPQTSITILNEASFTGSTTVFQGITSSMTGGLITIENDATFQPGLYTTTSSLTTNNIAIDGGTFASDINSGTNYSFVSVQGTVTLNNATFTPVDSSILLPSDTDELILIANNDTDAIVGTFLNLPEGSSIDIDGIPFTLSYVGGDGNDFSLVRNDENAFITTWESRTGARTITIPTFPGETYDYSVDWGDGNIDYGVTGDITHTYTTNGTKTVTVFGTFPRIYFEGSTPENANQLLTIEQWGTNAWTNFEGAFANCKEMDMLATDAPDLSNVTDMSRMFDDCESMVANSSINNWDVSNVINMHFLFRDAFVFNQPLNDWDVSSVEDMRGIFDNNTNFNQPLNDWEVDNLVNMRLMFKNASNFNQPLDNWDVSNVTSMEEMFKNASNFNQALDAWDVSNLTDASEMLTGSAFSMENYDNLLISWSQLNLQPNVIFDTDSNYCAGITARNTITDPLGPNWTITDGGFICGLVVSPKVYLQGAFTNPNSGEETLMRDDLRVDGVIPTDTPYSDGATIDASILTTTGSDAIVDWVWVELRDETDTTIIIDGQSALLQRDGDVVTTDGTSPLTFLQTDGNYFVTVNHTNHLGLMSANAFTLSLSITTIDLSSDTSLINGGSNSVVDMGNGIYAMYTGDYDGNGQVQSTDLNSVIPLIGSSGYSEADLDMNGQVQTTDINLLLIPNLGKGQSF